MKLKVLMSLPLDDFSDVVFLLGSSETFPEHLGSCDDLCANPRLKLDGAFILLFLILFGGCWYTQWLLASVMQFG